MEDDKTLYARKTRWGWSLFTSPEGREDELVASADDLNKLLTGSESTANWFVESLGVERVVVVVGKPKPPEPQAGEVYRNKHGGIFAYLPKDGSLTQFTPWVCLKSAPNGRYKPGVRYGVELDMAQEKTRAELVTREPRPATPAPAKPVFRPGDAYRNRKGAILAYDPTNKAKPWLCLKSSFSSGWFVSHRYSEPGERLTRVELS